MYKIVNKTFHDLIISDDGKEFGPFNRFQKTELLKLTQELNNLINELEPIHRICSKYNIPIADLPEVLEEYICSDNDRYYGYSKCSDCKNECSVKDDDCTFFKSKEFG